LSEDVADDRDYSALAIHHRGAGCAMIDYQSIVSLEHLKERSAGEFVAFSIVHESATNEALLVLRIGEGCDLLVRCQRFYSHP
jgi:hypothetical protein